MRGRGMIHYHGMSSGGGTVEDTLRLSHGRHVFVSYADAGKLEVISKVCSTFALDNGAYSAWRRGDGYDFEGYEEFVRHWHRHPSYDWCVIPDVIDGSEDENDELLARWPDELGGVPVWHMDESLERLDRLAGSYGRLALGSSGVYDVVGSEGWWSRMGKGLDLICDERGRPKVKLHGMRMLNWRIFTKIPLSSADSTNAERNSMETTRINRGWNYRPRTRGQRASVIACVTESHQSAETWEGVKQDELKLEYA